MKIMVFGATGRVGRCFVARALAAGHEVTAFVRDGRNPVQGCRCVMGDVTRAQDVNAALNEAFDVVVVCIGSGVLRPSRLVTEGMGAIVAGMQEHGLSRLLGVSGTAEMPHKTAMGRLYTAILRRTPVGHAVRDHDGAFAVVAASGLSWVLAGCNYIANGKAKGRYRTAAIFPGGFKKISPGDVADFLLGEAQTPRHDREIVGIWY
jgi:uncharacterized protein